MNKDVLKNNARDVALQILTRVTQRGSYSNLQLNQALKHSNLANNDKRFVTNLVYGVLQHKLTLEYWLTPFIHKQTDPWVKVLLMTAIYQYQYLDRVPQWAVTDETIKLAKYHGNPGIRRFVTGVLHAFLRQGPQSFEKIKDIQERLATQYSVPKWLVSELSQQYGQQQTVKILESINQPSKISVRVNTAKISLDDLMPLLAKEGIKTEPSKVSENGLVVDSGSVIDSDLLAKGLIIIQDESAMLAAESLHVKPTDKVLDACAAPGGKTGQIAERISTKDGGHVDALDIHGHKVRLINKNMQKMGVSDRVSTHQLDARRVDEKFKDEYFDKILVDAPCSGIGLIRRKPEIRYDKNLQDSLSLHKIQLSILNAVATKLKKGGILVYSTCTILQQENDNTINEFLNNHPDYRLLKTVTTRAIKNDRTNDTLTILPSDYGSDGFFIGTLQRLK